jgi:hypothetical protein
MTNATQKPAPRRQGDTRSPDADKSAARRELRTLDADRIVVLRTMLERTPDELRVRGCDPETIDLVRQVQRIEREVREGHEQCHRFLRARQAAGATPPA